MIMYCIIDRYIKDHITLCDAAQADQNRRTSNYNDTHVYRYLLHDEMYYPNRILWVKYDISQSTLLFKLNLTLTLQVIIKYKVIVPQLGISIIKTQIRSYILVN